jgi:hypothetical protein
VFSNKPIQFKIALVIAALESLVSAGVTLFFIWGLATGQAKVVSALALIDGLLLASTIFLIAATIALIKLKRWGRSAIIFWQLIQISLGYGTMEGQDAILPLAIAIFAISGTAFVLLLSKPVNALFSED